MKYRLSIRPTAVADVNAAAAYIAQGSVEHALRLYDAVDATYRIILRTPLAWTRLTVVEHPRLKELRHRPVLGFARYIVVYRVDAEDIVVLHITHTSRNLAALLGRETLVEPDIG